MVVPSLSHDYNPAGLSSWALGVREYHSFYKPAKTVILDGDLEQGFSMAVANKHALDLGAIIVDKVVISNHGKLPGVTSLDKLISEI
jgi:hypothetical protein